MTTIAAPAMTDQAAHSGGVFTGTGRLLRLALRRDRIRIPAWAVLMAVLASSAYSATAELYPDPVARRPAAELFNTTPSLVAMFGRVYDVDSLGSLATIKLTTFYGAAIAILLVFHAVRHTRADEDAGRVELVNSAVVGRLAPLAAAMLDLVILAAGIGFAVAVAMAGVGAAVPGALAFGLAWAVMALVYGLLTAVLAQIVPEARPVIGLGVAAVGVGYLLRALGDLATPGPGWATWLSPIGWGQQIRPFAGDRYWIAALPLVVSAGLAVLAFRLRSHRDLGSGMVPEHAGPAGTAIATPLALALRLNRGLLIGWAIGLALMGGVVGSMSNSLGGFLNDPKTVDLLAALGGRKGLVDMFLSLELGIIAAAVSAVGIAVIGHMRREEENGRTELVLSETASRLDWLMGSLVVALAGVAALMMVLGLAVGIGAAAALGDWGQLGRVLAAAAARVPAAWVMVGIAVALYGFLPRLVALSWLFLLGFFVLGDFAALWGLPGWVADLSPFTHSPNLPGGSFHVLPVLSLVIVAAALIAAGTAGWLRRDLISA